MKQVYSATRKNILSFVVLVLISLNSLAATIIVPAGTTLNYTGALNGDVFQVYGVLNFTPSNYNGNGNAINVYEGGELNFPNNSEARNIIIDIRADGLMNLSTPTFRLYNDGGIRNAGTVRATGTSFTSEGTGLDNSGLFQVKNLTVMNSFNGSVGRINTGTIMISDRFTINAIYENGELGHLLITGGDAIGLTTNQNPNLINNGKLDVTGKVEVNGDMTLNGTMIVRGDLIIKRKVSGSDGKLGVVNGQSTLTDRGYYQGSNMQFCDQNSTSIGNNFDVNTTTNNKSAVGVNYTINCNSVFSGSEGILPLRFVSFESADYNQFSVYFRFVTTEESGIQVIELQGSNDGSNFTTVEKIAPHNTNGTHRYTTATVDKARFTTYRVAVIDIDGKRAYSKVLFTQTANKAIEVSIFPNPITNGTFTVKVPSIEPAIVNVFSQDGKVIYNTVVKGQLQHQVKLPQASRQSMLIIQVVQNGNAKTFNILSK